MFELLKNLFAKPNFRYSPTPAQDLPLSTALLDTPQMTASNSDWWDIYRGQPPWLSKNCRFSLNTALSACRYVAEIASLETKISVSNPELNAALQDHIVNRLPEIIERALVGGFCIIKPFVDISGGVSIDIAYSFNFTPENFDEQGNVTAGFFTDKVNHSGRVCRRLEHHFFNPQAGLHTVRNEIFIEENRVPFGERPPVWEHLSEESEIPTDTCLIAIFRVPNANFVDLNSKLPVSFFAGAVPILRQIDFCFNNYFGELYRAKSKIFLDTTLIKSDCNGIKRPLPDDFYVHLNAADDLKKQLDIFTPNVREEAYRNALNTAFRLLEGSLKLSFGTFALEKNSAITATQIVSQDKTTFNTVRQIQDSLFCALQSLFSALDALAKVYGSAPCGDTAVDFGDSVFEDTETEFKRRFQMVSAGLLKPELLVEWYFGVTPETAKNMIAEPKDIF
jgi:A118 family predicted phage portal protein